MRNLFLKWVCLTLAVIIAAVVTSALGQPFKIQSNDVSGVLQLFVGAAVLGLVNATLGRVLKFITAPLNCMTLGLLSLIINAGLLMWVGNSGFGFTVGNFLAALIGSIIISLANGILGGILIRDKEKDKDE